MVGGKKQGDFFTNLDHIRRRLIAQCWPVLLDAFAQVSFVDLDRGLFGGRVFRRGFIRFFLLFLKQFLHLVRTIRRIVSPQRHAVQIGIAQTERVGGLGQVTVEINAFAISGPAWGSLGYPRIGQVLDFFGIEIVHKYVAFKIAVGGVEDVFVIGPKLGLIAANVPKFVFEQATAGHGTQVKQAHFLASCYVHRFGLVAVEGQIAVVVLVLSDLFFGPGSIGWQGKPVLIPSHGLGKKQRFVVFQPMDFQRPALGPRGQVLDEFALDIRHKDLPTRDKGQLFAIIRYIKGGDVALDVKILQLIQGDVLGNADGHSFGPFFLDVVHLDLVIAAESHFFAIGTHLRVPDRSIEVGQLNFAVFVQGVQVVFPIGFVGNEVKIALAIKGHSKILARPIGVLFELARAGIVGLYIGIVVTFVTFAGHSRKTFPGLVEKNLPATWVLCNVVDGMVVMGKQTHGGAALHGNLVPAEAIVARRGEIDKTAVP